MIIQGTTPEISIKVAKTDKATINSLVEATEAEISALE
jgi:hypothetical protein